MISVEILSALIVIDQFISKALIENFIRFYAVKYIICPK